MSIADEYQLRWLNILVGSPADDSFKIQIYNDMRQRYAEKHRAYHNFAHIKMCLQLLDEFRSQLKDAHSVELALWFHDVIYDTRKQNNEKQSARYAEKQLKVLGFSKEQIQYVYHLILLTQHPANPKTSDEKYLIDIDLAILGISTDVFDTYTKAIRVEYEWVDLDQYNQGRVSMLRSFLRQQAIYQTHAFYQRYEQQARLNLQAALQALRQ